MELFLFPTVIFAIAYIMFNIYLIIHMMVFLSDSHGSSSEFVQNYVLNDRSSLLDDAHNAHNYQSYTR